MPKRPASALVEVERAGKKASSGYPRYHRARSNKTSTANPSTPNEENFSASIGPAPFPCMHAVIQIIDPCPGHSTYQAIHHDRSSSDRQPSHSAFHSLLISASISSHPLSQRLSNTCVTVQRFSLRISKHPFTNSKTSSSVPAAPFARLRADWSHSPARIIICTRGGKMC